MKKYYFLFFISIIGCEPDNPPFHCDMQYYPISSTTSSFINNFKNTEKYYYKNNVGGLILFNNYELVLNQVTDTTSDGECYSYDYLYLHFVSSSNNSLKNLSFHILPSFVETNNLEIIIGKYNDTFCSTTSFKITTETDLINMDSVEISNEIFYDVYYRTDNFGCASEMYYNKQYGVVGFNWLGEWYVLETDSL